MTTFFYQGGFPDRRLEARANLIHQAMCQKESAIANRYCATAAAEMGNRRFMNHPRLSLQPLKDTAYRFCRERTPGKRVLALQDTSEINYQSHAGRLSRQDPDLGPVGNNDDFGVFLHPTLVVDRDQDFPLGFASIWEWNRFWDKEDKEQRRYKSLPLEEKESYRWIAAAEETKRNLPDAAHILFIADREGDIYEEFVRIPDQRCDVLVRCCQDRTLYDREESLFEYLRALPAAGEMTVRVAATKKRPARQALLELRFGRVRLARPQTRTDPTLPPYVEVSVVEACEKGASVPLGEAPVLWRLSTSLPVTTLEEARQCTRWYGSRWWMEDLFRVVKSDGLDLEAAQWEKGAALKRLAVMALAVALQILQLTKARSGQYDIPPETVFTEEELRFQEELLPRLEGKTAKQKNPYPRSNLAWSAWIIARLGGWKTYYSRGAPPGLITMKRGMECFKQQVQGWSIASAFP